MSWGRKLAKLIDSATAAVEGRPAVLADDVGLVTQNGFTVLLGCDTPLPARFSEIFSTRDDGQAVLPVELYKHNPDSGETESLGRLLIDGITPAPAGVPEIQVTLVVDPSGWVQASSLEAASGRKVTADLGQVRVARLHR